jgi:hypothetical protein
MTGAWDRDLARDLDVIRAWGASAVVTLLEPSEHWHNEKISESSHRLASSNLNCRNSLTISQTFRACAGVFAYSFACATLFRSVSIVFKVLSDKMFARGSD